MKLLRLIIWKEFMQMRADPMTLRLIFLPIILQVFVLGYAITTEVKNTTMTILDRSNTPQSASLVQAITHNSLFVFKGYANSENQAREMLDNGKARLALVISETFSKDLILSNGAKLNLLIDGQDANSSSIASGYINAIITGWSISFLKESLAAKNISLENMIPVNVHQAILFNPLLKSSWYMIPALAVILVTMITALLTGFSIVKEKEAGTLEQLMVTPLRPIQLIIGKIVPYIIIGIIELCLVLVFATLWFRVPFRGDFFTLIVFALIYMISSLGLGILISTIAKNAQQVLFMLWFLLIFFMFLSGFFLALENMPKWVQNLTLVNPLRYFMFILREMFLKGSGFAELWKQGAAMLAIGVVVFGLAVGNFRRKVG